MTLCDIGKSYQIINNCSLPPSLFPMKSSRLPPIFQAATAKKKGPLLQLVQQAWIEAQTVSTATPRSPCQSSSIRFSYPSCFEFLRNNGFTKCRGRPQRGYLTTIHVLYYRIHLKPNYLLMFISDHSVF